MTHNKDTQNPQGFYTDKDKRYRSLGRTGGGIPLSGVPWYEYYYGVSFGGYGGYAGNTGQQTSSEESDGTESIESDGSGEYGEGGDSGGASTS